MCNVGIYVHPLYYQEQGLEKILDSLHAKYSFGMFCLESQADILPLYVKEYKPKMKIDYIFVFGGDGTILRAVDFALETKAPILGINFGNLGFLSELNPEELDKAIKDISDNRYQVQSRMLLEVRVFRDKYQIHKNLALNDTVIFRANTPRMIEVKVKANGRTVYTTRSDGVVVSTPTGSTAYSLSAGGPILDPVMEAICFCPINPHILSTRPIVFSSNDNLSFEIVNCFDKPLLQIDGLNSEVLEVGDIVKISKACKKVDFVKLTNNTFYKIMRKKMHMGRL